MYIYFIYNIYYIICSKNKITVCNAQLHLHEKL